MVSSRRSLRFPAKPRINNPVSFNEITSSIVSSRRQFDRNETSQRSVPNGDARNREACFTRMHKNIVSARSQGHPTVNDIAVNDKILGMTVQPCRIHTNNQLVTWKQISRKKDNLQADNLAVDRNLSRELRLDLDRLCDERNRGERNENRIEEEDASSVAESRRTDDKSQGEIKKVKSGDVTWLNGIQNLNRTYLIRDSEDIEPSKIFHGKWRPIKHSPRVEFYLKDREGEICEFERTKLKRETLLANGEDRIEVKVSVKNEEDETMVDCKIEESKTNDENMENNRKMCSEEIEVTASKTEALNINSREEENKRRASYEEIKATEYSIKKTEINTEDTKETEKMDGANVLEMDKLSVHKEDEKNRQIAVDKRIIESTKCIEETERNSSESGQIIKSSSFDVHSVAWNISKKENVIDQHEDYLNFKEKVSQCKSSCNNSFELKENTVTFTCDQSNINKIISLNNSNNQVNFNSSPENETLACQNNNCRNSLDSIENIKEISFSAPCRSISPEKNYARNIDEIGIDEENYENLINLCNKKPKRNSERLNSEVYSLPRNLEITAGNYLNAPMNNIPVYVKNNKQNGFSSDFENIKNNTKDEEIDFNTDSDNSCSNDKSRFLGRSIIKTEITTGEGLCKKNEFDYGSDNTARVGECNSRDVNGLGSSVMSDDAEEKSQHRGNEIFLNANFPKRASGATERAARERPANSVEMKHRIRESMNLLRGSTDSLISSVEFVELASLRRPEANCTYERETIEIIRPNRWSKSSKDLPDIKSDAMEAKEDSERSYWERTSTISRSRLTSVCPAEYKFAKRNPRVRILPPVLNPPLVNRR